MPTIPKARTEQLEWIAFRLELWIANAEALGLDEGELAALQEALDQAVDDDEEARQALSAARTAFQRSAVSLASVRSRASMVVQLIRARATALEESALYALAGLEPPRKVGQGGSTKGPPGMPVEIRSTIDNLGRINLSWNATDAAPSRGAIFQICRKLDGESIYSTISAVQGRKFTDADIPPGTRSASYIIRGYRGNQAGEPGQAHTVYLHSVAHVRAGSAGDDEEDNGESLNAAA